MLTPYGPVVVLTTSSQHELEIVSNAKKAPQYQEELYKTFT